MLRLALLDDHPAVLAGLRRLVEPQADIRAIAWCWRHERPVPTAWWTRPSLCSAFSLRSGRAQRIVGRLRPVLNAPPDVRSRLS
jgi:hypothetical protein